LRKSISADRPGFKVKAQTHGRIICTRKCRYQTHEFNNGRPGNRRIERDHAWLRNFSPLDIAFGHLSRVIGF